MNRVVSPRQRWRVNLPVVIWVWLCLYVAVTSFQYLISGEQISLLRFFFNGGLLLVALLDIARRQVAEVFQHSQESIIIADSKGTILNVNPAFTRITGYALEEARGKNPRILSSGRQNRQFYEDLFKQLRAEGFWSGQFWNKRKNGEHYLQRGTISAVFGDSGKPEHYIAIMEDASVYREAEERIQALANYDALGHYYGDELLKAVCKRLKLHVKETDTLCRFGGDEFILLMQGGAKEAGRSKASGGPISLYTHLPFCAHLCYYCACNKVITKKRDKAMPYVARVLKEAAIQSKLFGADLPVHQLHWVGGTPTLLPPAVQHPRLTASAW
ncbi:MAG: PAS domain S-box protein, partial [Alteromonadaceae bacterium]|nr:PAS domain S-box protein [Alteromonadaceae bacterium]